jgi:hypothetical protein
VRDRIIFFAARRNMFRQPSVAQITEILTHPPLSSALDPEPKIRKTMVKCLVTFLTTQHAQADLCADVNEALAAIILRDPTLDISLLALHEVCKLALSAVVADPGGVGVEAETRNHGGGAGGKCPSHHPLSVISSELLRAVGNLISSKNKKEHKDAVTGLAQIYQKHYLHRKLKYLQEGGDDVSIDEILQVWRELKPEEEEKLACIPQRMFKCMSYPRYEESRLSDRRRRPAAHRQEGFWRGWQRADAHESRGRIGPHSEVRQGEGKCIQVDVRVVRPAEPFAKVQGQGVRGGQSRCFRGRP